MKEINLPINLFELDELKLLETYTNSDLMVLTWLKLVTKSKRKKNRRFIYKVSNNIELTDKLLAHLFKIEEQHCSKVFSVLEDLGFVIRNNTTIEVFRVWESEQRDRSTPEYKQWRLEVFERDNYTCQFCNKKGGTLNAHHIIHWANSTSKRFDITNGVALCESCHKEVHRKR